MYDIFYVGSSGWIEFKNKYPNAQKADKSTTYNDLCKLSFTKMFWVIWDDVDLLDFELTEYSATEWDNRYVHIFKNGDTYDGICLFPKNLEITEAEFRTRYFSAKKEVNIRASSPKQYDIFEIANFAEYELALKETATDMFWAIWPEIEVTDESVFDTYFSHHDSYNRNENHVFTNRRNGAETFLNGLVLFSKNKKVSEREIKHRYLINKKEHNRVVSINRYPRCIINDYEDYQNAIVKTKAEMFWAIWPEIEITDESVFDLYFDPRNGMYDEDRAENHAWQHQFRADEVTYGGLHLMCKNKPVSKKEIDFRFLINKKEHEEIVSQHRLYDIVFISYNEPNADENYEALQQRFPHAKRVHGVKGIHQAHIAAAKICDTEMFWVVDGDAVVNKDFDFSHVVNRYELSTVHVWRSQNPVNDLVYGYGGIKLLPTKLTINMDTTKPDMTTSISERFKAVQEVSNITVFNTDPFNTWKGAFRECAKLASKVIDRQKEDETNARLETWTTVGHDRPFGEYALRGARAGMEFGLSDKPDLKLINDFDWLKQRFDSEV